MLKVFLQTVEPCLRFIDDWVRSGCLCDPHNEFFIQRFVGLLLLVLWFLDCISQLTKILVVHVNSNPKKNFDFHWILNEVRQSKLGDINLRMKQLLNQHWDNICNNYYIIIFSF